MDNLMTCGEGMHPSPSVWGHFELHPGGSKWVDESSAWLGLMNVFTGVADRRLCTTTILRIKKESSVSADSFDSLLEGFSASTKISAFFSNCIVTEIFLWIWKYTWFSSWKKQIHGQIFTKVFVHMYLGLKELLKNERNIQRKNNSIIIKTMLKS